MGKILDQLQPNAVWNYFEEICSVPRPSKQEQKMTEWLLNFAQQHHLQAKRDKIGNVLIKKGATKGYKDRKTVVFQSHIDMVCEKNSDTIFDFEKDAIQPVIDGEWVHAKGTTLGADDGIGVAAQLAILTDNKLEHGPIECLFTVDEETGLTGAFALKKGFISGDILLNLDSEDEGEIFIGCAGGGDTTATFNVKWETTPANSIAYQITVKGLKGGHSGDEIDKNRSNSNKLVTRILYTPVEKMGAQLFYMDGGNKRNAIPRECTAHFIVPASLNEKFLQYFNNISEEIKSEILVHEPNVIIELTSIKTPTSVWGKSFQKKLVEALYACPNGVIEMSTKLKGLVETSTNLASVKVLNDNKLIVGTSQRSSVTSAKTDIMFRVESVFKLAGAKIEHSDGYPGWDPNPNSDILKIAVKSYKKLFDKEPIVRAIHAGLECGLFLEKYPDLDMVSFGPTLKMVHTPEEKIEIATVQKFWDLIVDILKNIPQK
ncbi:MAG: aminoacyl-histidine dipeptidase [Bacteroidales bacterium]|nr:aminoacyl-histidine dipeptidase [Bacteroidales bacterium]